MHQGKPLCIEEYGDSDFGVKIPESPYQLELADEPVAFEFNDATVENLIDRSYFQ